MSTVRINGFEMPRLSFKPDASFFRKIVVGAVGARTVIADLARHGHSFVELERGSADTKLWKEVKRKRVRIPDLVCTACGVRVECRAKTKLELAMSHSPTDAERAWDFGMVDGDWIAFPVCETIDEIDWSTGQLRDGISYWRQKNWARWESQGTINYFKVSSFRGSLHSKSRTKGVEEGSENVIAWDATFSTRSGLVERIVQQEGQPTKVTILRQSDSHRHTWKIGPGKRVFVGEGEKVGLNQVIAASVPPLRTQQLMCTGTLPTSHLEELFRSRERTQRFTGVKLARLRNDSAYHELAGALARDPEEDVYVRLEATSYLNAVCGDSAPKLFSSYLESGDEQTQLEAVIALGEAATDEATGLLCKILGDRNLPFFLRSAAAWSLSQTKTETAGSHLIAAFNDIDLTLREDALEGLVTIGGPAMPVLLNGLRSSESSIAAGCAEALRRSNKMPASLFDSLISELGCSSPSRWAVWLVGHLPREQFASAIAGLQDTKPELHYAISLIWSFVESWTARNWDLTSNPQFISK